MGNQNKRKKIAEGKRDSGEICTSAKKSTFYQKGIDAVPDWQQTREASLKSKENKKKKVVRKEPLNEETI